MSHSLDLIIPLALCVSIAYLVSGGTSLYEGQKVSRDDEEEGYFRLAESFPHGDAKLEISTHDENPSGSSENNDSE